MTSNLNRYLLVGVLCLLHLYGGFTTYKTSTVLSDLGDETFYQLFGATHYWPNKNYAPGIEHPPVTHLLATAPKYFFNATSTQEARLSFVLLYLVFGLFLTGLLLRFEGFGPSLIFAVLYNLDPNIKAHAAVIGTDFPVGVFALTSACLIYIIVKHQQTLWIWPVAVGFFGGLAATTKVSALLFMPFLFVGLMLTGPRLKRTGLCLIGFLLAFFVVYGFKPDQVVNYWKSLEFQSNHVKGGHRSFIWGKTFNQGVWWYFLVAMLFKTPLLTMGSYMAAGYDLVKRWRSFIPVVVIFALPSIGLLYTLSRIRAQPGYRYFLPGIMLITMAVALVLGSRTFSRKQRVFLTGILCALVSMDWIVFRNDLYLSYFNSLTPKPFYNFADSNSHWGQAIPTHIAKNFPEYPPVQSVKEVFQNVGPDQRARFSIGHSLLADLWGFPRAPAFRAFTPIHSAGGFAFYDVPLVDLFSLFSQLEERDTNTDEVLRAYEKPLKPQAPLNCDFTKMEILSLTGANKINLESARAYLLIREEGGATVDERPILSRLWYPQEKTSTIAAVGQLTLVSVPCQN